MFLVIDSDSIIRNDLKKNKSFSDIKKHLLGIIYEFCREYPEIDKACLITPSKEHSFRKDINKNYLDFISEFPNFLFQDFIHFLNTINIPYIEPIYNEAEDILLTLYSEFQKEDFMIITQNPILLSSFNDKIHPYFLFSNKENMKHLTKKYYPWKKDLFPAGTILLEKDECSMYFGFSHKRILDFFSLYGLNNKNILGLCHDNKKSVISLINKYASIEQMFNDIDNYSLGDSLDIIQKKWNQQNIFISPEYLLSNRDYILECKHILTPIISDLKKEKQYFFIK